MIKKLLVIKILKNGLRVIDLDSKEYLSLKTDIYFRDHIINELETIDFEINKEWTFKKQKYASGLIRESEFILSNIQVKKIEYESAGIWDPHESFGAEADEYFADYLKEGFREAFIFKDYSGYGFYEAEIDPVSDAAVLMENGNRKGAYDLFTRLWEDYPECFDALVHLGILYFDNDPDRSLNFYTAAVDIVERSLPAGFDGIFLWGFIENRPYLRALQGLCLILWKIKNFDLAFKTAEKLLRLCPTDNLGIKYIIDHIKNHDKWHSDYY